MVAFWGHFGDKMVAFWGQLKLWPSQPSLAWFGLAWVWAELSNLQQLCYSCFVQHSTGSSTIKVTTSRSLLKVYFCWYQQKLPKMVLLLVPAEAP
jgi:hypothetical protein